MSETIVLGDVQADVRRIQEFDANSLVQRDRLGEMSFEDATKPAQKLIDLFKRVPAYVIDEFPFRQKQLIQNQAKSTFALFDQILNFRVAAGDPESIRQQYIEQLVLAYQDTFDSLHPLISYLVSRTVDFGSLEAKGRAAIQAIDDDKNKVLKEIQDTSEQAEQLLINVRDAAAQQGVTQMAKYFRDEAIANDNAAGRWLIACIIGAIVVATYSFLTLYLSQFIKTTNAYESAQVITSKFLVFGVLAYGLFQCVRSYSAHRHNSVTNKHRQNALMTYTTLAEAGNTPELRDAVLQHAAAAIYAPNDSGYLKGEERGYGAQSLLALLPRASGSGSGGISQ